MKIAFYSPLKAPTSGVPSGDLRMANTLIRALESAGHCVKLASEFRSREPLGDPTRQKVLRFEGHKAAEDLINKYAPQEHFPDLWFTYHVYYKAPDWIGPLVAKELNIPYVIAEASHAPKRAGGPWNMNHQCVENSIKEADLVVGLNSLDAGCVKPLLHENTKYLQLKPFIDFPSEKLTRKGDKRSTFARDMNLNTDHIWFLTVAMMRKGAKHKSYEMLAKSLHSIKKSGWQLLVAGDGPVRSVVEALFDGLPTTFVGQQDQPTISNLMTISDVFLWPAIEEAYGMAMLEAQGHGLPVIAGNTGGVGDIIRDGVTGTLTKVGDVAAFSNAIRQLMDAPETLAKMGLQAQSIVKQDHSISGAAQQLDTALTGLISG
ncbi:MAG TPA: glycosyltransferase family 1 protein [Rhodospirillales bacterium]|nr:glycosyltransferase family 1 protein [Rhodospirillales bacterium]